MAVPKKRTSAARRDKRRSHLALTPVNVSICDQCGAYTRSHRACPECGYYKGRIVVKQREK
ncbi:MAG TPA: 50S ribosomal protein L32 [Bacteroidetes bacterium]|nr:50S ribosomal protein L32 [bacterium BMS3Bbin04]HDO65296.1 50S ribosomal protein L32 [Bacteroidota bacterium]HEX04421.1 50S ribosomal protein L32 [Bacteroidota bacterium]